MPDDPRREFYHPGEYGYLTVCTPSVHDTSTLRGWWEEDLPTSQRFFNRILGEFGEAPKFCDDWLARKIIQQHLDSRSMLAVFPLQVFGSISYRIMFIYLYICIYIDIFDLCRKMSIVLFILL